MKTALGMMGLIVLCGCGEDELDQTAANSTANEAINVSSLVYSAVSTELKADGSWVTKTGDSFTVQGSLKGAQGGTATVSGSGKLEGTIYTFDLDIELDGWKGKSGLILDGTFKTSYEVTNLAGDLMTIGFSGELSVSGSASGAANLSFDVVYTSPMEHAICGTVSGMDVSTGKC